jgi:hypothetical protein
MDDKIRNAIDEASINMQKCLEILAQIDKLLVENHCNYAEIIYIKVLLDDKIMASRLKRWLKKQE